MPKGQVKNRSDKVLWVVETDTGSAIAHKLAANRQSPSSIDADGFKAVDGTTIDGHTSWVKLTDISTADVSNSGQELNRGCIACISVDDNEFGNITFSNTDGWGEPIN
jgi:hypothetical protein